MGSKLKQNLSNLYYKRRNILTKTPGRITVLVENGADVAIWTRMLEDSCPNKRFDVQPYQYGMNKTESKPLILKTIIERGGPEYIGCVDSDQDRFLEDRKYPHGLFFPAHYIFQTYGYSIESLFCLPKSLSSVYITATSFQCTFNFEEFFRLLSNKIHTLLLTDLYMRHSGFKDVLHVNDWAHILPGSKTIRQTLTNTTERDIVASCEAGAKKYLKHLQSVPDFDPRGYNAFTNQFREQFSYVSPDNCVLFIYGHVFFDFVITLMNELRQIDLNAEVQAVYENKQMKQHVKEQKVKELRNLQLDIPTVLKANYSFISNSCSLYQMIRNDLQRLYICNPL